MVEEKRKCPECGKLVYPISAIRQGLVDNINVIDVGFRCPECGKEWGFEIFHDVLLWKQAEARLKKKLAEVMK